MLFITRAYASSSSDQTARTRAQVQRSQERRQNAISNSRGGTRRSAQAVQNQRARTAGTGNR